MGLRGPAPKPTALKVIQGVVNSRINFDEPQPGEGIPECPADDAEVIAVWDYTVEQLRMMKVISMGDRDALHAYCEAVVMMRRAAVDMTNEGVTTDMGYKHPAVAVFSAASATVRVYAVEFGLTPSARARIKVSDLDKKTSEESKSPARLLSS